MNNRKPSKYQRKNHALLCSLSCRVMPNSGVPLRPLNTQCFSLEVSILPSLLGEVDLVVNMLTLDSNYIQYTILRRSFISH